MRKPRICAVIVSNNPAAVANIEPLVDLFGDDWTELVKRFNKPWIACNRNAEEGGGWQGNEARRLEKLLQAIELGADIVDIELRTRNLENIVQLVKKRTKCLLSFHYLEKTPTLDEMKEVVRRQLKAGADICKVVTTAQRFEDNLTVLQLISAFPAIRLVSFAMGTSGSISRVLCPLVGGDFTYASIEEGKESAQGQITVGDLAKIYDIVIE
ncbi:type I 3-dehydroquinate dehydratase [Chloroflexota bacterium]